MVSYEAAKFVHITGIVMLMGNITATAIWKFFADRTGDPRIVAFAQRLITLTDWSLTLWGAALTVIGGYGAAYIGGWDLFGERWLVVSQLLFLLSGMMWLGALIPLQIRMAREARAFAATGTIPDTYRKDSRRWLVWGSAATLPLIAATWLMVAKAV